ncbi:MAG TPA: thiol:disulfide interchange protein DsbA/DsbL [Luteibacter sp.]|jgi:thiol:disulfide interchange protein DsbA|nr:thiol:disulfide interchange protein DsbA/DsbL [Luteibacter sp.]
MFKRLSFLLAGLMLATACTAENAAPAAASYTDGNEYITLPTAQRAGKDGKVEVVEVFSYGCIHCAHFEPYAEKLQKELPKGVVFRSIPAAFNDAWVPYARAFYAAQKLGALPQTHAALFKAIHFDHYPIHTLDELADFYAQKGVDRARFLSVAQSDEVTSQMAADGKLIQAWQVDGTPTIVVDGKYRVKSVTSFDQLVDVTKWLAQRDLNGGK